MCLIGGIRSPVKCPGCPVPATIGSPPWRYIFLFAVMVWNLTRSNGSDGNPSKVYTNSVPGQNSVYPGKQLTLAVCVMPGMVCKDLLNAQHRGLAKLYIHSGRMFAYSPKMQGLNPGSDWHTIGWEAFMRVRSYSRRLDVSRAACLNTTQLQS